MNPRPPAVLLVTYHFPPVMVGGVIRPLNFAKYLDKLGWKVIVLTNSEDTFHRDSTLLDDFPDSIEIERTPYEIPSWTKRWFGHKVTDRDVNRTDTSHNVLSPAKSSFLNRLRQAGLGLLRSEFILPDRQVFWMPEALKRAERLFEEHDIQTVWSTSPPQSTQLVGMAIHQKYSVPWIADFRDQWTDNTTFYPHLKNPGFRRNLEVRMERDVVRHASKIISVTESGYRSFKKRYPDCHEKFQLISNGFDEADFSRLSSRTKCKGFVIRSFGSVGNGRDPSALLEAFRSLRNHPLRQDVRIEFYGHFGYDKIPWLRELGEENVSFNIGVSHRLACDLMMQASALALFQCHGGSAALATPGKLYEYGRSRTPILGILAPGPAWDIVTKYRLGSVADSRSSDAVMKALIQLYDKWKQGIHYGGNSDFENRYNRSHLAQELDCLLKSVITKQNESSILL